MGDTPINYYYDHAKEILYVMENEGHVLQRIKMEHIPLQEGLPLAPGQNKPAPKRRMIYMRKAAA